MAATAATRLAIFGNSSRPHHSSFQALLPPGVELEYLGRVWPEGEEGAAETIAAVRAAEKRGLQGILMIAAPREVARPSLQEDLRQAVSVPVTTALNAGAAALQAFGARRALVLTPFDESIRDGIRDNLARRQIEARVPPVLSGGPDEAREFGPDVVYGLATKAWVQNPGFDALYFQGAVLDPLMIVERLEDEIGKPIVASNPAMLWYVLSQLGQKHRIEGYGRLLREWPSLPA